MTTRPSKTAPAETDTEATPETTTPDPAPQPTGAEPDLANVDVVAQAAGIEGATGTVLDGIISVDDPHPFDDLKALGNANADVNVTAVLNGHGTWSWTARDAEDGRELCHSGPHRAERVTKDLTQLFGGSTVALRATGLEKTKRLA